MKVIEIVDCSLLEMLDVSISIWLIMIMNATGSLDLSMMFKCCRGIVRLLKLWSSL